MSQYLGRNFFLRVFLIICCLALLVIPQTSLSGPPEKYKILHIMSYHSDWVWNKDQFNGFKNALTGLDIEYRVIEMDTKRKNSPEWMQKVRRETKNLINDWKPDLVYANDDDAQEYIVKDYVNSDIPFVFSAVNAAPEKYGFTGSKNVTGVLEQEHFVQTVDLLKSIAPEVKKLAIIIDKSPMWIPVLSRIKAKQDKLPDIEIVSLDTIDTFDAFKNKIKGYQTTVDALGLLGIFLFKDHMGNNVPYQDVLQWVMDNSQLPDFSFWKSRIQCGTLCTVTVSGYEQGVSAGKIAREILVESRAPASFTISATTKGEPVISLARARKLGLKIQSTILLTADIVKEIECRRQEN